MKSLLAFLFTLIFFVGISAQQYSVDKKIIAKDIENHQKAVHVFDDWMRDPYIVLGTDGIYYLTVTQHGDSVVGRKIINDGVPLYTSKNLADWKFDGYIYSIRKNASNAAEFIAEREKRNNDPKKEWGTDELKLWAPEIHFIDGKWCLVHTSNVGLGNFVSFQGSNFGVPNNGWNERFGKQHDPSIFVDDDGSKYLISRCAQIWKLKSDMSGFDGEPISINPSNRKMGHEGAAILKINGKYVFYGTAWSTDKMRKGTYNLYYCVSDKLEGPYDERKFIGRFLGHGTIFKDKYGRWWCTAFFNANKPPLTTDELITTDFSNNAYTINKQGLTLVPLDVKIVKGEIIIRAKDPLYKFPGNEEVQKFNK